MVPNGGVAGLSKVPHHHIGRYEWERWGGVMVLQVLESSSDGSIQSLSSSVLGKRRGEGDRSK